MKNILLLLALFVIAGCSKNDDPLLEKLKEAAEASEKNEAGYETINLAELTDFEWDTLYHFHQLDDRNYISRQVGFRWLGDAVPNLQRRLLFVKNKEVVKYIDYKVEDMPLTLYGCEEDRWVYPRSRATFATFKYCTGDGHFFPLIPVACVDYFEDMIKADCPEPEAAK